MDRIKLDKNIDSKTFREYYFLKEELIEFCKDNNLQTTGSKIELTDRIALFLETGERSTTKHINKKKTIDKIELDSLIEPNFVCSEHHRLFYKEHIGESFSFNVLFQKWLKNNSGKTYRESIDAYYEILNDKKNNKKEIDRQFEYNTYIRDFFSYNKDLSLSDAITCWKYKKSLKGTNKYEKKDLIALVKIREMNKDEYYLLSDFLYEAIFIPEGVKKPDKAIINSPELQIYIKDFSKFEDDYCLVAELNKKVVGACWIRIMDDYGHIDNNTPSLAISLYPKYRNKGIGTILLKEMINNLRNKKYIRISLSVQKDNYAFKMYKSCGFIVLKETDLEYIMVCNLI